MSNYAGSSSPPRTLTQDEQDALLRVSGERAGGFRDHMIFALALGAGLREAEIVGLDVADVLAFNTTIEGAAGPGAAGDDGQYIRRRVQLRVFKGSARAGGHQEAILSDAVRYKLQKYIQTIRGRPLADPLFRSRKGQRLSTRQVRELFASWQQRAGFERRHSFHALRHTYCANVYRESGRDITQVQRLARHRRIETSLLYTRPSDEQLLATVRKLR